MQKAVKLRQGLKAYLPRMPEFDIIIILAQDRIVGHKNGETELHASCCVFSIALLLFMTKVT